MSEIVCLYSYKKPFCRAPCRDQGAAQASSVEGEQQQQGRLGALLVSAIIKQVLASTFDNSHKYSGMATERLLATGEKSNGLLFGPSSPNYGKD